jgi:hypothetical protein
VNSLEISHPQAALFAGRDDYSEKRDRIQKVGEMDNDMQRNKINAG